MVYLAHVVAAEYIKIKTVVFCYNFIHDYLCKRKPIISIIHYFFYGGFFFYYYCICYISIDKYYYLFPKLYIILEQDENIS